MRLYQGTVVRSHLLSHSNATRPAAGHPCASSSCVSTVPNPSIETTPASSAKEVSDEALVRSSQTTAGPVTTAIDSHAMRLPVELEVTIPLRDFRVRNL